MNVLDSFKLTDKVAIVTGGAGHLGRAMVDGLCEAGAKKVYVLARDKNKYDKVFCENEKTMFLSVDICDTESVKSCFKTIFETEQRIDILVNNAAYIEGVGKLPEELSDEMWTNTLNGCVISVARCIKEAISYMKDGASIINIASMYGVVSPDLSMYDGDICAPNLNPVNYGTAKAGVIQLTKYYGTYLIKRGIRVNSITPGTYPSAKTQENVEFVRRLSEKNPAKRIGLPEDIKGGVVYLASDASKYVVGHNLVIDGGWTIW